MTPASIPTTTGRKRNETNNDLLGRQPNLRENGIKVVKRFGKRLNDLNYFKPERVSRSD
jgi:hypothetical protein